jgi:5-deoxy-glucuronate isomerase
MSSYVATTDNGLHLPAGSASEGPWQVSITPKEAGWTYTGMRIVELSANSAVDLHTGASEALVLPLAGSCTVESDGRTVELAGRPDVFAGATDFVYLSRDSEVRIGSAAGGRFAVPAALAEHRLPLRYVAADQVAVEPRGAGVCSRLVRNYCMPATLVADRLMDVLEEIYYFEVCDGPAAPGVAYQRLYGTADRPVEVLAEVRTGDVVLVPHGWHGPSIAPPGYDLYYLNAMAGPGERAWHACDDPAFAWVRETWLTQELDPRVQAALPAGRAS